jgi:hypothetical protein
VLWLQALVIQWSALAALRGELRARWEALLGLERLRLRLTLQHAEPVQDPGVDDLRQIALPPEGEGRLLPEDPAAVEKVGGLCLALDETCRALEGRFKEEAVQIGLPRHALALELRCGNARREFESAVGAYEKRRCALRMERLVAWFGYGPHYAVGRTPKVR